MVLLAGPVVNASEFHSAKAMKGSDFHSKGWERNPPRLLVPVLPAVGVLQFPLLLFLFHYNPGPSSAYFQFYINYLGLPSLLIFVISFLVGLSLPFWFLMSTRLRAFDLYLEDKRDENGELELTFVESGKTRKGPFVVDKVKMYPSGLVRNVGRFNRRVGGTRASMVISFKGRRKQLELGFATAEEMNQVYEQLV